MNSLNLKKCLECGALIKVIEDCTCDDCFITCCGNAMEKVIPNSVDASFEKHVPIVVRENDEIVITVNHVMEDNHYISFITYKSDDLEVTKYFKPGEEVTLRIPYKANAKVYSYCNLHGLWGSEVK